MMARAQFVLGLVSGIVVSMILVTVHHLSNQPGPATIEQINAVGQHISSLSEIKSAHSGSNSGPAGDVDKADIAKAAVPHEVVTNELAEIEGLLPLQSENHQDDDSSVADYLASKVRVLCWVMTSPDNLESKARHVYKTWAHRCNVLIFVSSAESDAFHPVPIIKVDTEEGREHLTAKTMHAFKYVYDNYFDKADWFMKADDDTFAIMENLRYFLADKNPNDPVYYGHHFKTIVKPQGYYSGGGGYVLSREALKRFVENGFHKNDVCREDGGAEDAEFGKCMQNLGVKTAESYDERGASRFHCFNPGTHIHGGYPDWYLQYDSHGAKSGVDSVSDYAITFHYVNPQEMYSLAWYTYHLKVYGIGPKDPPKLHEYYTQPK